jgi:hypothetical protein
MRDPAPRTTDPKVEEALSAARSFLRFNLPLEVPAPDESKDARQHRKAVGHVRRRVPNPVGEYLLRRLYGDKRSERTRRTATRNFQLALAVEMIRQCYGFDATRTSYRTEEKKRPLSGSAIVKEAVEREWGLHLSERTIEDAWTTHHPRFKTPLHVLRDE